MDLVPGHPSYLFTPLARKDQELNDGSVGAADLPGAAQDPCQLLIGKHSVTGGSLERGFDANARRGFQDRAANTPAEEPLDCLEQLVSRMIPPSAAASKTKSLMSRRLMSWTLRAPHRRMS